MEKAVKMPPDLTGIIAVEQFWIVWSPWGNNPQAKHWTYEKAAAEALRLSRLHLGQEFYPVGGANMAKTPAVVSQAAE